MSISRQCELLGINRSTVYYKARSEKSEDVILKQLILTQYQKAPIYGSRKMVKYLKEQGHLANRKRVVRLMRELGVGSGLTKGSLSNSSCE